ncbi:MAG: hypothetical protein GWN84_22900 [Gammaproteobacteria bacterium]|nr:hypothetical protein [Gammaproteobacteria bacterium]NIR85458.1 hypothetical protein [Gammaproteobacteria bacterium]NIR89510.1 hypothetical protein [Gammaproteobacteria bacterium]NIU06595.1 hypothetical protein [Gammaproteobacteria bacterium]NIV53478.1 hypothetical protein [Gammaproteobacteria bacterium]
MARRYDVIVQGKSEAFSNSLRERGIDLLQDNACPAGPDRLRPAWGGLPTQRRVLRDPASLHETTHLPETRGERPPAHFVL